MFQLNENSMKRIMREEYVKRLKNFLSEEIDIEYKIDGKKVSVIDDAANLKVRHDATGLEYTILKYDAAAGNVVLLLPDESRLNNAVISTNKLTEADVDNDGIPDELDTQIDNMQKMLDNPSDVTRRKNSSEKINLMNFNAEKNSTKSNKNYIVVPIEEFVKEYSL